MSSPLCHPDAWTDLDTDALVRLYDAKTTAILDLLVPARTVMCHRRPSDPWFDQECRLAKRRVRQLERVARSADVNSSAVAEWTAEHRAYRALLRRKREAFWTSKVQSERSSLRQLWRSVDALMGRGRVPPSEAIGARRRLRSASTSALVTPSSRRSTIGDQAFFVAAPRVWNSLPSSVTASQTLGTFRRRLKTHLFAVSLT